MTGFDVAGKTALVTGAAKRLGMHCALALADRGANVVVHCGASAMDAEALCADLHRRGVKAWPVQAGCDAAMPVSAAARDCRACVEVSFALAVNGARNST